MVTIFSCTNIQIVCVHGCVFFKYLTHFMNGLYPGCLESKGLKNVFLIAATSNQKTYTNHWLTQQRKDADVPRANNCIFKRKDILENWFLFRELGMIFCWTSPITPRPPLQSILIDKQLTKGGSETSVWQMQTCHLCAATGSKCNFLIENIPATK